jgi:hypothetical protein
MATKKTDPDRLRSPQRTQGRNRCNQRSPHGNTMENTKLQNEIGKQGS